MSYSFSADDDYKYWDNPQAVTVTLKRQAGDSTVSVSHALLGDIKDALSTFSSARLSGDEVTWAIPVTLLGSSNELEIGDTITHGSDVWVVRQVQKVRFKSQWLALCNKQRQ